MLFAGTADMPFGLIVAGVIWSVALGFAAGNYACSLVHRLPRKKSILENKPYCGECGHALATADLFPVVSALMLKNKCRYCGVKIPISHFWTEIVIGLIFALSYLQYNYSEMYFLVILVGVFLVTLACIQANEGTVQKSVLVTVLASGVILRTLADASIFHAILGGLYGLIIGMLIWRKKVERVNHIYSIPDGAKLLTMGGVVAGNVGMLTAFPLTLALYVLFKITFPVFGLKRVPLSVPLGIALLAILLFPQFDILLYLQERGSIPSP